MNVAFALFDSDCVVIPPPFIPPHKGEGVRQRPARRDEAGRSASLTSPSPLWGGVRGGGMPGSIVEGGRP
jgi:hypothetical protein